MRIGIFGGSFNPIHNAHVTLARTICEQAGLDEVWFMVSPHNPLKASSDLLDEHMRLKMVQMALEDEPRLRACDYEFHLPRPSFTWNTLTHLHHDFPSYTFYIIIGGDNWVAFPRWRNYEDILREHNVIVYPRQDSDIDASTLPHSVSLVNTPEINITSTMLREMLQEGKSISAFVPEKVAEFIKNNKLYQNK